MPMNGTMSVSVRDAMNKLSRVKGKVKVCVSQDESSYSSTKRVGVSAKSGVLREKERETLFRQLILASLNASRVLYEKESTVRPLQFSDQINSRQTFGAFPIDRF